MTGYSQKRDGTLHAAAAEPVSVTLHRVRRRRLPSQAEQQRRVEWGRKYGPMVGNMIRQNIARTER